MFFGARYNLKSAWNVVYGFFLMLTRAWGWTVIGIFLLLAGLVLGLSSHEVAYVQGNQGHYHVFESEEGFIIYQQDDTANYYVIHIPDFSPTLDMQEILSGTYPYFDFAASTDKVFIDVEVLNTGQYIPYAHPIEMIAFSDKDGKVVHSFTNAEYSGNPNGYFVNYWFYAGPMMIVGIIATTISLVFIFSARRRRKLAAAAELAEIEARPSPFARELAELAERKRE